MKTLATNNSNETRNAAAMVASNKTYRYDWNTREMVEIKGVVLEIGQKVRVYGYAMNWRDYVCTSEPDARNCQNLVEIGGEHQRTAWEIGLNDRSTAEVFGIGKYYDPSGERLTAEEIARHLRAADIQERWNERRERNQERADEQERQELRKQWAGVLVPLADVNDWKEREKQEKTNIINYLKFHHPRAKFTARKVAGGHTYAISWQDGPSIDQVKELTYIWHDHTFNGYEDYNDYTPSQFNRLFGGVEYSCDFNRRYSAAAIEKGRELFRELCPELSEYIGTGDGLQLRRDDCDALNDWADMTVNRHPVSDAARELYEAGRNYVRGCWKANPDRIITDYLDGRDLTPAEPENDPQKPTKGKRAAKGTDTKAEGCEAISGDETAPAEGLELQDIAEGVAVIGNSLATYKNRREIKAHGATWNKEAQQWQATDPEKVAQLRAWFALRDGEQTATASADETTEADTLEQGGEITAPAFAPDIVAQARQDHPEWPAEFFAPEFFETEAIDEHGHRIKKHSEIKEQAARIGCNYLEGRGSLKEKAHRLYKKYGNDHPETVAAYERLQSRARLVRRAELEAYRRAGETRRAAWYREHGQQADTLDQGGEITAPSSKPERMKTRGQVFDQYFRILHQLSDGKTWNNPQARHRADVILKALNRYQENFNKVPEIARLYNTHHFLEDGTDPAKRANEIPVPRSVYMGLKAA